MIIYMLWHTEFNGWLEKDILQYMSTTTFYDDNGEHSTLLSYIHRLPTLKPSCLGFSDNWVMDRWKLERVS